MFSVGATNRKFIENRRSSVLRQCTVCGKSQLGCVRPGDTRQKSCHVPTSAISLAHISSYTSIQIKREIQTCLGSKKRITFMSMFNDIEYWIKDSEETCLANGKEVTEYARQLRFCHCCFCGRGQEKVWYRTCTSKPNGAWDHIARRNDTEI